MYAPRWAIIPNLGTDLVAATAAASAAVHLAGRIVVGTTLLLPVIGTIAYSRAVFGRCSLWPLASGLVAYNATLLLGFLNFVAAIGIALLLAAAWIAWRDRHPLRVVALAPVGCVALFFCHLMGLLFFYVLIAGYELQWLWPRRTTGPAVLVQLRRALALGRSCRSASTWSRRLPRFPTQPSSPPSPSRPGNWSCRSPTTSCRSTSPRRALSAHSFSHVSQTVGCAYRRVGGLPLLLTALSVPGSTIFLQGHVSPRHPLRDPAGLSAVRRGAADRPAARHRFCRCRRVHLAVRRPHGHRRLCLARTSARHRGPAHSHRIGRARVTRIRRSRDARGSARAIGRRRRSAGDSRSAYSSTPTSPPCC